MAGNPYNLVVFFPNLPIKNMNYLHKSGAQKRKEIRKRVDNARRGLQTLFQCGIKKVNMILKNAQMQIWKKGKV